MLAAKPKFGRGQNRVGKENSTCSCVGVSCFKVYTESDTAKADAEIRSYATVNKVSAVENTAALKAGLKSMEKQKGILGSLAANANVGRRALADVNNVKTNSSRIVGGDASKKMVSVGTGIKTVNLSSRISFLGKERESPSQAISKLQTSKRAIKDLKAFRESKNQGYGSKPRTSNTSLKLIRYKEIIAGAKGQPRGSKYSKGKCW